MRYAEHSKASPSFTNCLDRSVTVPVMDVRIVRMLVSQRLVPMHVHVGLLGRVLGRVGVSMVLVMPMQVAVLRRLVGMHMLVSLAHVQPDATGHQERRSPEKPPGICGHMSSDSTTPKSGATEK